MLDAKETWGRASYAGRLGFGFQPTAEIMGKEQILWNYIKHFPRKMSAIARDFFNASVVSSSRQELAYKQSAEKSMTRRGLLKIME